ncbi:unnamed protein product [Prunus armeniaca]
MEDFKAKKVEEMVVIVKEWLGWLLECLQQPNGGRKVQLKKCEFSWLLRGLQQPRGVKGSVEASLFPMGKREHWDILISNRECLKNISFAHPHWSTPSNGLGLWCSQVASSKSPLSKSFRGPCGPL